MAKLVDLTGVTFGRLTVNGRAGTDTAGKTTWNCLCSCGTSVVATGLNLKSGNTKSCGCLKHRSGPDNPRTITDPARLAEKKRSYAMQRRWRYQVLRRDKCCLKCSTTHHLHAHHIAGYADAPHLRTDTENGLVLCGQCHTPHVVCSRSRV